MSFSRLLGGDQLLVYVGSFMLSFSILAAFASSGDCVTQVEADEGDVPGGSTRLVRYELVEGSAFGHRENDGLEHCFTLVASTPISGAFTMEIVRQAEDHTAGNIGEVDFTSGEEPGFRVSGSGFYVAMQGGDGTRAEGLDLKVSINGRDEIILTSELNIGHSFPQIEIALGMMQRAHDCYIIVLRAQPCEGYRERFFLRGDVDGNGKRDIADAIVLLRSLNEGTLSVACSDAGDYDDNGTLDLSDAICLLRFLFDGAEKPEHPSSFCGIDTTEDMLDCGGQEACTPPE